MFTVRYKEENAILPW